MANTCNIRNYPSLEIKAKCIRICDDEKTPIVFLIDESHHNRCHIDGNIAIAKELILNCNAALIGVEGYDGGFRYDYRQSCYNISPEFYISTPIVEPYPNPGRIYRMNERQIIPLSDEQTFSNSLVREEGILIRGVDCSGYYDEYRYFHCNGLYTPEYLEQNSLCRSYHFIRTLFTEYRNERLTGNIILNCGSHHNEHIRNMVLQNEIEAVAGMKASYYVIRNIYHPYYEKLI